MANIKITQLTEIVAPANDDVLPIVDVSGDITQKVQAANLPISTATQTALDGKQATLVSGTSIKTINSESLLGSGDIAIEANPAGTAGQIQFSDGSAFAADSNLYWDNTNKRLGVGTNSPSSLLELKGTTAAAKFVGSGSAKLDLYPNVLSSPGYHVSLVSAYDNAKYFEIQKLGVAKMTFGGVGVGVGVINSTAQLQVKGSGSLSGTTALLVQNSSGTAALTVKDDLSVVTGSNFTFNSNILFSPISGSAANFSFGQNGSGRGVVGGVEQIFGVSGAGGVVITESLDVNVVNTTAQLEVRSTTKGLLPPRMTTTQKNAISSPAAGLVVYDNTLNRQSVYTTAWQNTINETNGSPNSVANVWSGSQTQYDALTPDSTTLYFIV